MSAFWFSSSLRLYQWGWRFSQPSDRQAPQAHRPATFPWHRSPPNSVEHAPEYWANRRGLPFGVPQGAYSGAVGQMRQMEAAQAALAGAAPISAATILSWSPIGPLPMMNVQANFGGAVFGPTFNGTGRITAIAADPQAHGRLFVGAANGGVWMSSDGGTTFKPIFDAEPTQAIGAIAFDPVNTNPTTIYVATGEGNNSGDSYYGQGIFKSTDLGATWTQLSPSTFDKAAFTRLAVDTSHNPPVLFAAADGGNSLGRAHPVFSGSDPTKFGLWRSTDAGNSWSQYPIATFGCQLGMTGTIPCPAEDVVIDPSNSSQVYAGIEFDNVFRSSNGGNTWSPASLPGIPTGLNNMDRQSVAIGPPTPGAPLACSGGTKACGTVYAMIGSINGTSYVGFFKSIDGGATWTAESVPSATFGTCPNCVTIDGTSSMNFSQEFYDQALLVLPGNPSAVGFGGVGIYASINSGATWTFLASSGGTHSDQHALAIDPFNANHVYVGNDGGLYLFDLTNGSFTALNSSISAGQIQGVGPHPTNNGLLIAGFQDNGTQRFTGSPGWNLVDIGDGGFALFDHSNPNFAYHTRATIGLGPVLSRSSDGGTNWDFSNPTASIQNLLNMVHDPGAVFYPPLASDPTVAERVFFGAHGIYVSTDGMLSWQLQSNQNLAPSCSNGSCALQDIEFVPSDHTKAWALSTQTMPPAFPLVPFKVFNTTQADLNSGATWNDVTANLPFNTANTQATGIALDPFHAQTAWLSISGFTAATGIGHVFRTTDFGAHWTRADGASGASPLPDIPVLRLLVDNTDSSGNTLLAATDIGVFRSTDAGATWQAFNQGVIPAVPAFDIEQNNNGVIFVGTHGRGAYQLVASASTPTPTSTTSATPTAGPAGSVTPTSTPTPPPTSIPTPAVGGSITVTSAVNVSGSPGQTLAAGSFTLNNSTSGAETISSLTVAVSDAALYSSLALTATVGASSQTVTVSPPSSSTVFNFSPTLSVPGGSSVTFSLSATISMTPAMIERRSVVYAAMLAIPDGDGGGASPLGMVLMLLGLGLITARPATRRRTVVLLALLTMLAASQVGCGGGGGGVTLVVPTPTATPTPTPTPKPSSTQLVTAVSATGAGLGSLTFTGLPASLGKVSLQ